MRLTPFVVVCAIAMLAAACADDPPQISPAMATLPTTEAPAKAADNTNAHHGNDLPPDSIAAPADAAVTAEVIAVATEPISTAIAPNGEFWLAERGGLVVVLDPITGETGQTVLDISSLTVPGGEQGLLSIAVDGENLYVDYTDTAGDSKIDAYPLDGDGRPGDRHPLLTVQQPFTNHNGGGMAIGPDGYLYIGFGDGGNGGDPKGSGQDSSTILGSIARIDPTPGMDSPYSIPSTNPFADGDGGRPEIFLTGVRNPWRFAFDQATDNLWIGDVGQDLYEEVDLFLAVNGGGVGANLGWNHREGLHKFKGPNSDDFTDPVFEYPHGADPGGCSVTGGYVYRGSAIPSLRGAYIFGDFCTSRLWALSVSESQLEFTDLGVDVPGGQLASFGVDPSGEILTLSLSGHVSRIVPKPAVRTYPRVADNPEDVASRLVEVEQLLRSTEPSRLEFADLAHEQQVMFRTIGRHQEWAETILDLVPADLLDAVSIGIDARISIGEISNAEPPDTMPAWEIIDPLPLSELVDIYRSASNETGIPWTYLAAINMVETGFGRIVGLSTAGAQGPMQFMPATWAEVGTGSVDDPNDAIPAAARYLVRRGGPDDLAKALRGYNNSAAYVDAVTSYAQLFARDFAALEAAHSWEIHYSSAAGDLWLPVGYREDQRIPVQQFLAEFPYSMPPDQ